MLSRNRINERDKTNISLADYANKLKPHAYMKEAHKKGKQPRIFDGMLNINNETGKIIEIPPKKDPRIQQGT